MNRNAIALTAIGAIIASPVVVCTVLFGTATGPVYLEPSSVESSTVCLEDEPCWDCSSMGNLVCGIEGPTLED